MSEVRLPPDHQTRMERFRISLDGLSVGDAFGGQFFIPGNYENHFENRSTPEAARYCYTDDTEMALGLGQVLDAFGEIRQDKLARVFAVRYANDMYRGYGAGAHRILASIGAGTDWREAAGTAFGGQGSFGNGGAMRVAPLGGYFAHDFERAAKQASLSAEVTHAHPEGQAGAMAVAVAAAWAWQNRNDSPGKRARELLEVARDFTPPGLTRDGIETVLTIDLESDPGYTAWKVGNGSQISSQDTVPFTLWCAAKCIEDYPNAIWCTIAVGGDIDTTAAIVGGIVSLSTGRGGIPQEWLARRESLQFR